MSSWFHGIKRYLWSEHSTPYHAPPDALSASQAHRELLAYAVFLGSVFAITGVGGLAALLRAPDAMAAIWTGYSVVMLAACTVLPTVQSRLAAWLVMLAPACLVGLAALSGFAANSGGVDKLVVGVVALLFVRYGWRVVRIVYHRTGTRQTT